MYLKIGLNSRLLILVIHCPAVDLGKNLPISRLNSRFFFFVIPCSAKGLGENLPNSRSFYYPHTPPQPNRTVHPDTQQMTFHHPPAEPLAWLPPISGLIRRDPEHRYYLHGQPLPVSVTGVLSILKSAYAMARIEATCNVWAPRGGQTHRALELALGLRSPAARASEGQQEAALAELASLSAGDHADWIQPLITHPRWDVVQVVASERATCCPRRGVAGTYDTAYVDPALTVPPGAPVGASERLLGTDGAPLAGALVLADLKTLGEGGSTYSTAAQLGGYMALEATHGHCYHYGQTIWARPGETRFSPLYTRAECLLAWAGAWAQYRAVVRPTNVSERKPIRLT